MVCTDRGQHPRALIAYVSGAPLSGQDPSTIWQQTLHGEQVTTWQGADGWRTYRFRCRRCGRDVQLREPKLMAAVAALAKSGIGGTRPHMDISYA